MIAMETTSSGTLIYQCHTKTGDYLTIVYATVIDIVPYLLWSPYVIGQTIIFLPCAFYLSFFFLSFFFPRLISAAVDWMSTILPHTVWP